MSVRDLIVLGSSSQQPTRSRSHGAYLLRWNDEGFLFDPGEGVQRQFIFANIAPTAVTRILISHFHGDHCLGLGSMIMRLNLDKIKHKLHCYYPESGKKYFERLRYSTIYHENIEVVEHPVSEAGIVHDDGKFRIEANFLEHSVECLGWRLTESDSRKFYKDKLKEAGIKGPMVKELIQRGVLEKDGRQHQLDDYSYIRKGDAFAMVSDTRYCQAAIDIAKDVKLLLCESTYLEEHKELAQSHYHLTAAQAADIAKKAAAKRLLLTHFSARYRDVSVFKEQACQVFANSEVVADLARFDFPKNHSA